MATETSTLNPEKQTMGEPGADEEMNQMTSRGESREEVSTPMESLAKFRHQVRLGPVKISLLKSG